MPPFDPTYPPTNALIESAPLRGNFNGLKDLIDAISTITAAVIDSVTTLPPGDPASVSVSVTGNTLHFTFSIPQGETGAQGIQGFQGPPGEVTQAAMDAALALKAQNPSTVNTLPFGASANYDQVQQQDIIDKMNELINALK